MFWRISQKKKAIHIITLVALSRSHFVKRCLYRLGVRPYFYITPSHHISVIRKFWCGGILGNIFISIRTKIRLMIYIKKFLEMIRNSWSGTAFHWSGGKIGLPDDWDRTFHWSTAVSGKAILIWVYTVFWNDSSSTCTKLKNLLINSNYNAFSQDMPQRWTSGKLILMLILII